MYKITTTKKDNVRGVLQTERYSPLNATIWTTIFGEQKKKVDQVWNSLPPRKKEEAVLTCKWFVSYFVLTTEFL